MTRTMFHKTKRTKRSTLSFDRERWLSDGALCVTVLEVKKQEKVKKAPRNVRKEIDKAMEQTGRR